MTCTLHTTPDICDVALAVFTPMEQTMMLDAWIAQDAAASHKLLGIVRQQHAALFRLQHDEQDIFGRCYQCEADLCATPPEPHAEGCTWPGTQAALDAAAPWIHQ